MNFFLHLKWGHARKSLRNTGLGLGQYLEFASANFSKSSRICLMSTKMLPERLNFGGKKKETLSEKEKEDKQFHSGRWGQCGTLITTWSGADLPFCHRQNSAELQTNFGFVKFFHRLPLGPGERACFYVH